MRATKEMLDGFEDAIRQLIDGGQGVYYWTIDDANDDSNTWAIVLGWADDDGNDEVAETDKCNEVGWSLAVKIAFQSANCGMQCDYHIDWLLPYDKQGDGDVMDCEWYLSDSDDFRKVLKNVVKDWNKNKKQYIKMVE